MPSFWGWKSAAKKQDVKLIQADYKIIQTIEAIANYVMSAEEKEEV